MANHQLTKLQFEAVFDTRDSLDMQVERNVGVGPADYFTIDPPGKFNVTKGDEQFLYSYSRAISRGDLLTFNENSSKWSQSAVFDLDFKQTESLRGEGEAFHLYSEEEVLDFVKRLQATFSSTFSNLEPRNLLCCILTKPSARRVEGTWKDGIHLHFPNLVMRGETYAVVVKMVQAMIVDHNYFAGFSDVLDAKAGSGLWLLYGSRKQKAVSSVAYDLLPFADSPVGVFAAGPDSSLLPVGTHYEWLSTVHCSLSLVEEATKTRHFAGWQSLVETDDHIKTLALTMALSKRPRGRGREVVTMRPELLQLLSDDPEASTDQEKNKHRGTLTLAEADEVLKVLSPGRCEAYEDWVAVGMILHHEFGGDEAALQLWDAWSSSGTTYNPLEIARKWVSFESTTPGQARLGAGTLYMMAKEDNPEAVRHMLTKSTSKLFLLALSNTDYDVANLIYHQVGDDSVCVSMKKDVWYHYNGSTWTLEAGGDTRIKTYMSTTLVKQFSDYRKEILAELDAIGPHPTDDEQTRALKLEEDVKSINQLTVKLKTQSRKTAIFKETAILCHNARFEDKIDSNPYLIAFQNGVYDLRAHVLRAGRRTDYLCKVLPVNYVRPSPAQLDVLEKFLIQVFPDREVRDYFLEISSEIFEGRNARKIVLFWTGTGDNGKSVTQKLFEKMLGPGFSVKTSTKMLTGGKIGADRPDPFMARCRGTRWVVMEEPDYEETIKTGLFKSISGGDTYVVRDLYQGAADIREAEPMCKIAFICNTIPKFQRPDAATFRRMRIIPFETTFVDDAPATFEEQLAARKFPKILDMTQQIEELKEPFAWYLLERYRESRGRVDAPPAKVMNEVSECIRDNDIFTQYFDDTVDVSAPDAPDVGADDFYEDYKMWHKANHTHNDIVLSKTEFRKKLAAKFGLRTVTRTTVFKVVLAGGPMRL